jgi:hypothetical protein
MEGEGSALSNLFNGLFDEQIEIFFDEPVEPRTDLERYQHRLEAIGWLMANRELEDETIQAAPWPAGTDPLWGCSRYFSSDGSLIDKL